MSAPAARNPRSSQDQGARSSALDKNEIGGTVDRGALGPILVDDEK